MNTGITENHGKLQFERDQRVVNEGGAL